VRCRACCENGGCFASKASKGQPPSCIRHKIDIERSRGKPQCVRTKGLNRERERQVKKKASTEKIIREKGKEKTCRGHATSQKQSRCASDSHSEFKPNWAQKEAHAAKPKRALRFSQIPGISVQNIQTKPKQNKSQNRKQTNSKGEATSQRDMLQKIFKNCNDLKNHTQSHHGPIHLLMRSL